MADPWAVLGLGPGASLDDARAARRRLAKRLHPDLHASRPAAERAELARQMTQVNLAIAALEAAVEAAEASAPPVEAGPASGPSRGRSPSAARGPSPGPVRGSDGGPPQATATLLDAESFALDALPAEAFEAVFLAGYNLGEILVADEPYALELYLPGPPPCFCQLHLVPEAGGSIVTADLTPAEGAEMPDAHAVLESLVAELNRLAGATTP